ncbi:MAG: hypothetical protein ILM98_13980 [Kiritimatiellae bacterium]|nr:hypothetical protein [Kiritimatiellia bacterium]
MGLAENYRKALGKIAAAVPDIRCRVRDAGGDWHDAIHAPESIRRQAGEYGVERYPGGVIYVSEPFRVPEGGRLEIVECSGATSVRRVLEHSDVGGGAVLRLGEEA